MHIVLTDAGNYTEGIADCTFCTKKEKSFLEKDKSCEKWVDNVWIDCYTVYSS